MPRGSRRTSYVRDGRGRFASTPGGGAPKRPPAKKASRGTNRLTRDNSGRITSVGGNGATARGGRLRTGAGNLRARQTDRLKGAPLQGVVSRGGKARAGAAKKPAGWMQSPEARKDRVQQAADRKGYAKKLRALPKDARRAIQVERLARRQKGIVVAGSTASQLTNIAEGRMRLIGNVGKRKDKLTPGQIGAMARTMSESARRLKVGMATGRRGRMRYNPNALQIATGTAARKIRGARVGGVARKGKAAPAKPIAKVDMKQAISRAKELRQQASKLKAQGEALMGGGRRDGAIVNIPLSSRSRRSAIDRGIRGSQLVARAATLNNRAERVLERAVASRKKAEREAAQPAKAPRSAESLRLSRAKQVEKRRSINISNPAGNRAEAAGRMAANAARTQQRALAFYGGKKPKKVAAAPTSRPTASAPKRLARGGQRITVKVKRTPKPTKQDKAFESVMNLKGVTDYSMGGKRSVWIDNKMMTQSRRRKLGLSGSIAAESDRYYVREGNNPVSGGWGYFMGTRSGWAAYQPKVRQGVIRRPRKPRRNR